MKRKFFLSMMTVLLCTAGIMAQRYSSYASYSYGDRYSGDRYGSQAYDSPYNYTRYLNRMTRADRRCVLDLLDKLDDRKRKAWRDGYISDYEARRIRKVERSIERVVDKYKSYDRYTSYGNNRTRSYRNKCR